MSATDETYYSSKRLHVAFAVAVLALLAATVWMLAADSRRPWKELPAGVSPSATGLPARSPAIEQIWLPELTIDYNFRRVARFDRCTTCHQGIDRRNPLPRAGEGPGVRASACRSPTPSHPRLDLFVGANSPHPHGGVRLHDLPRRPRQRDRFPLGLAYAERSERSGGDGASELGWSANPHWDFPMLARRFSQSRCLTCHHER